MEACPANEEAFNDLLPTKKKPQSRLSAQRKQNKRQLAINKSQLLIDGRTHVLPCAIGFHCLFPPRYLIFQFEIISRVRSETKAKVKRLNMLLTWLERFMNGRATA